MFFLIRTASTKTARPSGVRRVPRPPSRSHLRQWRGPLSRQQRLQRSGQREPPQQGRRWGWVTEATSQIRFGTENASPTRGKVTVRDPDGFAPAQATCPTKPIRGELRSARSSPRRSERGYVRFPRPGAPGLRKQELWGAGGHTSFSATTARPPQGELISGRQACGERRSTLRGPWARRRKNGQGDTGQPQGALGCTSVVQTGRPAARRCGAQCRCPRPRRPFGCPCPALISLLQGKPPLTQFPAPRRCPQRPDPCWLLSPVPELDGA